MDIKTAIIALENLSDVEESERIEAKEKADSILCEQFLIVADRNPAFVKPAHKLISLYKEIQA